jgi:hypothetical protein
MVQSKLCLTLIASPPAARGGYDDSRGHENDKWAESEESEHGWKYLLSSVMYGQRSNRVDHEEHGGLKEHGDLCAIDRWGTRSSSNIPSSKQGLNGTFANES